MKKTSLLILTLLALGQAVWAQSINVSDEQALRQFLSSNVPTATLSGNITLSQQGELEVNRVVTINLNNFNIIGNSNSRIFNVKSNGNLTLTGSGNLVYGQADNGGAIYNAGTLTLSGGLTISNNTATNGGAVYNAGTMTMNGGNLMYNTGCGGAIYNAGTLTITNGYIQNNTSDDNGGGVYNNGTLKMKGDPRIVNNTANGSSNNVYLPSGKNITVNGAFTSPNIYVTRADGVGTFTSGYSTFNSSTKPSNVFHSDNEDYTVRLSNGEAVLALMDWPGEGTEDDPYLIYTSDKLDLLATRVNSGNTYNGDFFKLMNDITYNYTGATNENNYTAIGNSYENSFKGHFDGNNMTVSGIRIYSDSESQGLFGFTDGTVKDLTLDDAVITGGNHTGGIAGQSYGTITNCQATDAVTINGYDNVGGVVGVNYGTVSQCNSSVTLTRRANNCEDYGAIAGFNDSGTLSDNFAFEATVPAASEDHHGAIAGKNEGNLARNYYLDCTVAGVANALHVGCAGADVTTNNGALSIHKLSLSTSITANPIAIHYDGLDYYAQSNTITLECTTPLLYGNHYVYSVDGDPISGDTFIMPAADATVTITTTEVLDYELMSIEGGSRAYYRFNYPSTSVTGEPVTLSSALVFWKPSPMESNVIEAVHLYSHHTVTANSQCPSLMHDSAPLDPNYFMATLLTSGSIEYANGNYLDTVQRSIVIMPDYEGYGVSSDRTHPYLVEGITAQQTVDAMICGLQIYQHLVDEGIALPLNDTWRSFSSGYSQGGSVALAVHRYIEQHNLSNDLHFRGSICGDGPYDLITTLRYYLEDDGDSYGVSTEHFQGQCTLPLVIPMIMKGMMLSDPYAGNHSMSDYLSQQFIDTGILEWLEGKTMTNDDIAAAWIEQLNNGFTAANGTTYTPEQMAEMFTDKSVSGILGTTPAVWADLSMVFTPGFYNYLADANNFNSVPTATGDPYQDMHRALANNELCIGWNPSHRIVFKHSKFDMVVPYGNYLAFSTAHDGEGIRYKVDNTFSTDDHLDAGTTFFMYLYNWMDDFKWLDESPLEVLTLEVAGYGNSNSGWVFIASPVTTEGGIVPSAVSGLFPVVNGEPNPNSGDYDLYRFNQSNADEKEWENYKNPLHNDFKLVNGHGYLYARKGTGTLVFTGPFNTGETMTVDLDYDHGASLAGYNLVGNPFPRAAYITDRSYYKMSDDGSYISAIAASASDCIPPCTGVIVQATTTGQSVTFSTTPQQQNTINNGNLHIALSQVVEPVETPVNRGNGLSTSSGALTLDNAIVSFNEGSELGKFYFGSQSANIYIPQGGEEYAIVTVGRDVARNVSTTNEVPLNFKAKENGTYTISVNPEGVEMAYLHLIDNMTGVDVDLLVPEPVEGPASYTFQAKTTDYESRFKLVFSANGEDGPSTGSGAFAYVDASGNIIITDGPSTGSGTLQIVDVTGRIVVQGDAINRVSTSGMTPGVYVLRLINGNEVKTQKIVR